MGIPSPRRCHTILHFRPTILRFHQKPVKEALYRPGLVYLPKQVPHEGGVPGTFQTPDRYIRGDRLDRVHGFGFPVPSLDKNGYF